jgi:hypothetical protein
VGFPSEACSESHMDRATALKYRYPSAGLRILSPVINLMLAISAKPFKQMQCSSITTSFVCVRPNMAESCELHRYSGGQKLWDAFTST